MSPPRIVPPPVRDRLGALLSIEPPRAAVYALARIGKARLNIADAADAVRRILTDAVAGRGASAVMLDVRRLGHLAGDPAYRAAYERATYVMADGAPLALMARRSGARIAPVEPADLAVEIARAAALVRVPIYLFGATGPVLDRAADRLMDEAPGLRIAGIEAPGDNFDPAGPEAAEAVARIDASGARLCLVAVRGPSQELFANAALCRSSDVVFVCVGDALEALASAAPRGMHGLRDRTRRWLLRLAGGAAAVRSRRPEGLAGRRSR